MQLTQFLVLVVKSTAEVETAIVNVERVQEYCEVPQEVCPKKSTVHNIGAEIVTVHVTVVVYIDSSMFYLNYS